MFEDHLVSYYSSGGYRVNGMVNDGPILGTNGFRSWTSRRSPHQRRRAPTRSVLGCHPSSKILEPSKKRSDRCRKDPLSPSGEQQPIVTSHNPVERPITLRRSERLRRLKTSQSLQGPEMSGLGPIHSSRVAKAKAMMDMANQPILPQRQSKRTRRPTTESGPELRSRLRPRLRPK